MDEYLSYDDSDHASLVGSSGSKEFSPTQENDRKDDITIPISKLNKILEELDDLKKIKESRDGNWQFKPIRTRKNEELFGDSFLKYVEEEKCFGKQSHANINACFTTQDFIKKLKTKEENPSVTHVVVQCGFNDLKQQGSETLVINNLKLATELLRAKYPNALTLIGEIISHPQDNVMNSRIKTVNFVLQSNMDIQSQVRYVSHLVCLIENSMFADDGIHLNKEPGTPRLLKDFYRVSNGKEPFKKPLEARYQNKKI